MSDEDTQDQQTDGDEQVTLNRSAIRSMEADAKEARRLKREMAFMKAGIDTDQGIGKLAFNQFDGEPTVEAVRAFAEEYGITAATAAPQPDAPLEQRYDADEQRSSEVRRMVASGAGVDDGSEDPSTAALRVGREAQKTRTNEDALVAAIITKATAAKNGDRRALVQERPR
jgi:hypothetical protein